MRSLRNRLQQQRREEAQPVPVFIEYDVLKVTRDQAVEAAMRSGNVPQNAVLLIFPRMAANREEWARYCQAELVERERRRIEEQQQREQAGMDPAESSTPSTRR